MQRQWARMPCAHLRLAVNARSAAAVAAAAAPWLHVSMPSVLSRDACRLSGRCGACAQSGAEPVQVLRQADRRSIHSPGQLCASCSPPEVHPAAAHCQPPLAAQAAPVNLEARPAAALAAPGGPAAGVWLACCRPPAEAAQVHHLFAVQCLMADTGQLAWRCYCCHCCRWKCPAPGACAYSCAVHAPRQAAAPVQRPKLSAAAASHQIRQAGQSAPAGQGGWPGPTRPPLQLLSWRPTPGALRTQGGSRSPAHGRSQYQRPESEQLSN